jgi:hypothetical protein
MILPISTSQAARITELSHCAWPRITFKRQKLVEINGPKIRVIRKDIERYWILSGRK